MSLIPEGVRKGLILISQDERQITYLHTKIRRNFTNPEEKVQAEAYLKLILQYNYKPQHIRLYETVTMGSEKREADIIVYNDDAGEYPHILVECKSQDVSEQAFLQAIEQAYSYAYALPNDIKYVWVTSGLKDEYFEVDKKRKSRITQPDIPQYGVVRLANYKYVYDANVLSSSPGQQKFDDLTTIDQDHLTKRFKQAHDALWAGGQLNPSEAFDELDKLIFCKIWDERKDRKPGEPYDFQIITVDKEEIKNWQKKGENDLRKAIQDEENRRLFDRISHLYEQGRKKDPEVFRDNIRLTNEKIRTVVGYLADINLGETDLDSKGRAFETFMNSFFRGSFGQYFTPRPIVDFTTRVLPITNESLVLDTSCGSGGFLLYALNKIRKQADALYPNYKTDPKQAQKHYKYWNDFAKDNLYGIEINEQIGRAAKMNMIIHDDGHTNVITADGLLGEEEIERTTKRRGFRYNRFDFIITNPPFGSIVRQTEKAYLKEFQLGKKEEDWLAVVAKPATNRENQSTEILFIEQCYKYLKPGGYLAIVVPDGILTNSSLQYVRDWMEEAFRIIAVVSLPQTAFTANGAGVKSSVLFLKKKDPLQSEKEREQDQSIKYELIEDHYYLETIKQWDQERKAAIKRLEEKAREENPDMSKKEIGEVIKDEKEVVQQAFSKKWADLKEKLEEKFLQQRHKKKQDYPIFMAIANDIGYDATGKKTNLNELETIGESLEQFILSVEEENI